jgi:uncharacterized membrane protein YciS (DUF1049 family)
MKKILVISLLFSALCFAQAADTIAYTSTDSIDLHALVEKQIAAALDKQLRETLNPQSVATETKAVVEEEHVKKEAVAQASANMFFNYLLALPWQYTLFAVLSFFIVGFVLARRLILSFTRTSNKALKKKIGLLREERVGGSKEQPKLSRTRKVLKENLELLKHNDKQLSKRAKQLNLSKGELLLAARLKLYEVGKM